VLKEVFSELCWKNRLKLETDKAEVLNMFLASAQRDKGRSSSNIVLLAPVLKGRVQGTDVSAVSER